MVRCGRQEPGQEHLVARSHRVVSSGIAVVGGCAVVDETSRELVRFPGDPCPASGYQSDGRGLGELRRSDVSQPPHGARSDYRHGAVVQRKVEEEQWYRNARGRVRTYVQDQPHQSPLARQFLSALTEYVERIALKGDLRFGPGFRQAALGLNRRVVEVGSGHLQRKLVLCDVECADVGNPQGYPRRVPDRGLASGNGHPNLVSTAGGEREVRRLRGAVPECVPQAYLAVVRGPRLKTGEPEALNRAERVLARDLSVRGCRSVVELGAGWFVAAPNHSCGSVLNVERRGRLRERWRCPVRKNKAAGFQTLAECLAVHRSGNQTQRHGHAVRTRFADPELQLQHTACVGKSSRAAQLNVNRTVGKADLGWRPGFRNTACLGEAKVFEDLDGEPQVKREGVNLDSRHFEQTNGQVKGLPSVSSGVTGSQDQVGRSESLEGALVALRGSISSGVAASNTVEVR